MDQQPDLEQLWQFSGHGLKSNDFNTALVHFYRGELSRSNTWRARLDTTTNWAVITTGATLSFAFGSATNPAVIIIVNTLLVLLFLLMESRRYRYYELWMYRVRIIEQNFFARLLSPPFLPNADWADRLTDSINRPRFPISLLEAFGRRYRRNYAPIFLILAISWLLKVHIHPTEAASWGQIVERARLGPLPGELVLGFGILFHTALFGLGLSSMRLRLGSDKLDGGGGLVQFLREATREVFDVDVHLPHLESRKQMAFIISDSAEKVGKALLTDLKRGVTLLHGTGLYTGKEHGVLMVTLESRQLPLLRQTVQRVDKTAFLIVSPVHDARGSGFRPLEA